MRETDATTRGHAGGSLFGDALRALARLEPQSDAAAADILALLQIRPPRQAGSATVAPAPGAALPEEAPDDALRHAHAGPRLSGDSPYLPPLVESEIEETTSPFGREPEWLSQAALVPVSQTLPNPFRQPIERLFQPAWERAIITRLASTRLPLGPPDVERMVACIADGRPLRALPRRNVLSAAKGVQLLVDTGESMEPYRLDVTELGRAIVRTIGAARVSVQSFRGFPEWGCGTDLDWTDYRAPPAGMLVVMLTDLGLAPRPAAATRTPDEQWRRFFKRLEKSGNRCAVVVPRDGSELPASLSRSARLVPWTRRTLASRLDEPRVGRDGPADANARPDGEHVLMHGEIARLGPQARELASLASLATRIEPQLLRALRMAFLPDAPVSAEAEIWFSGLVAERASTGIVLSPPCRQMLQRFLSPQRERVDRAYALIEALHRDSAPILRMEEELTWRWLTGDAEASRALLQSLVATLVAPERQGVWKWAAQAVIRLPRELLFIEEGKMLAVGTALRTGDIGPLDVAGATVGCGWNWLRPQSRELELGVNLRRGAIEFVPRAMRAAHRIRVPDSNPVLIEITAADGRSEHARVNPVARSVVPIEGGPFVIDVLGGSRWRLFEESETAREAREKLVGRLRTPQVQIEYEVETYGSVKKVQLPFVMGVMADLSGGTETARTPVDERGFLEINADNFESRLREISPRIAFRVSNLLTREGEPYVTLNFESMGDFSPVGVVMQISALRRLLGMRIRLLDLSSLMNGKPEAEALIARLLGDPELLARLAALPDAEDREPAISSASHSSPELVANAIRDASLDGEPLDALLNQAFRPSTREAEIAVRSDVLALAHAVSPPFNHTFANLPSEVPAIIDVLDSILTNQLDEVMHHPTFQNLESTWRGLQYLVNNTETDDMLKIRVMNISKSELNRALRRFKGDRWDQSPLFRQIYEREFGVFGGQPFGVLIGDYYFDQSPRDVECLGEIAKIAAAAHAPFIAGAAPGVLLMDSWQELANPRDLTKIFDTPEYAGWRSLRQSEDARYLGLAMPRFLGRVPYGAGTSPVAEFAYEEDTGAPQSHEMYMWINSAYAMAANINRSFKQYRWCARIRGIESGGEVSGLPVHSFPTDDGGVDMKCPTEIALSDRREAELAKRGFMPLVHRKNTDFAYFIGAKSLLEPFVYEDHDATANAALAARLPYLFACCRFAHYVKCMMRDKIGSFKEVSDAETWLSNWIVQYVDDDPTNSSEYIKAQKPLAGAEVKVSEVEGQPGYYQSTLYLRPHFQLEGLTVSLRLVTRLPSARSNPA